MVSPGRRFSKMPQRDSGTPSLYWRGFTTIIALGVLTWAEFQIRGGAIGPLIFIGLVKAALILQFFMHIARVWKPE